MGDYDYWRAKLRGETPPVHDADPQSGFYRKRIGKERADGFVPVAIWRATAGNMVALVDGKVADAADIWTWVCGHAITKEWYDIKMSGQPWPDEDAAAAASMAVRGDLSHGPSNEPPSEDVIAKDEIDSALAGLSSYAEIGDDITASKAQALRSRLLDLSGKADKKREVLKRPHLDAGRKVDDIWNPLVKLAKDGADKLRQVMSGYETRKRNEAIAAANEAAAVETARLAAEAKKNKGRAPAPAPPPPPIESAQIRGGTGRAAAKVMKKVAKVTDQDMAYMAMRTHPELVALIAALAQRAVTAGIPVNGVTYEEIVDVR